MIIHEDILKNLKESEVDSVRLLLSHALSSLGFQKHERVAILLSLRTRTQIAEMAWWLRLNIKRKPNRQEVMEALIQMTEYQ